MRAFKLIGAFMRASLQEELAYRANFGISLLHSLLNLAVGVLGMGIIFGQVSRLQGWDYSQALALLGVYLLLGALRGLFIGPSLESLVGMGQEVMSGQFDFTLLRPVPTQFLATFRHWRLLALLDVALAFGVIFTALGQSGGSVSLAQVGLFLAALLGAVLVLYAILLIFTSLAFFSPGSLFTWVFDAFFNLARYPVGIYPAWLKLMLTWIIPVGLMTTLPAQALTGQAAWSAVLMGLLAALALLAFSSFLFSRALRTYQSASS